MYLNTLYTSKCLILTQICEVNTINMLHFGGKKEEKKFIVDKESLGILFLCSI